ncbi:hypothetical protein VSAK1_13791 [Vibrio mediterranei AK1]|uniref:phage tail tube protein n=1 Tax=Vibrio mediterranei TaxID=689 RepID=UPI00015426B5|nr:phage tail tube protein [Vibrio mediterranei]EDL52623.1 hypothetical protein VSAK1_13791 [Vibrio mediterranei AK1]
MGKITSRAVINAGSLGRLPIEAGAEIGFGNIKREERMGDDGVLGYTEEYTDAPYIKATIIHAKETDEEAIAAFVDEDVTLETNTGRVYTLKDAWNVEPLTLNVKEGKLDIFLKGDELIPQ